MMRLRFILWMALLPILLFGQAKTFLPFPVTSSNGRPINNADVDLYKAGTTTKQADLTYLPGSGGWYYWTGDTLTVPAGNYDVYVNGYLWRSNVKLDVTTKDIENKIYGNTAGTDSVEKKGLWEVVHGSFAFDTTALKQNGEGLYCYLAGLSASNRNGGGWFVEIDSTYPEGIVAFDHPVSGKQWKREDFDGKSIYSRWFSSDNIDEINRVVNLFGGVRIKVIIDDTLYVNKDIDIDSQAYIQIVKGGFIKQGNYLVRFKGVLSAGRYQIFETTRNVEAYVEDFWFPEWFGAIPDGDKTDDTEAINLAIYSCQQSGGGIVSFQSRKGGYQGTGDGHYLVSERYPGCGYAINLYSSVILMGTNARGDAGSRIRFKDKDNTNDVTVIVNNGWVEADTTDPLFRTNLDYNGTANPGWWFFSGIRNLVVDCNGDSNSYNINGIDIYRWSENSEINNVSIYRYKGFGLRVNTTAPCYITNISVWPASSANQISDEKKLGDWRHNQRIGVMLYGSGVKNIRAISGDNNNPILLMKKVGANTYVNGIKSEFPDTLNGIAPIVIDSTSNQSGIVIMNTFSDRSTIEKKGAVILVTGDVNDKPTIYARNINANNSYKFLYYNYVENDSILLDNIAMEGFETHGSGSRFYYGNGLQIRNDKAISFFDNNGALVDVLMLASNNYVYTRYPALYYFLSSVDGSIVMYLTQTGVRIGDSGLDRSLEVFGTAYMKGGLKVGPISSGFAKIDSIKVTGTAPNDSLSFWVNGIEYVMPRR